MLTRLDDTFLPPVWEDTYDPARNIGRALIDAAAGMKQAVQYRAKAFGISSAQWVVLIRIGGGVGRTASELCRVLGYDSGAMTRMLDRLEKLGLIRRQIAAEDGRVTTLSLTAAGDELYPRLRPIAVDVINLHLQGFTPDEIEQFQAFLERVVANGRRNGTGCISADGVGAGDEP
ncbi:Transcriptional regulator SlyA [Labrys miyagiensis]